MLLIWIPQALAGRIGNVSTGPYGKRTGRLGWGRAAKLQSLPIRLLDRCSEGHACNTIPLLDYGKEGMTDLSYSVGRLMFATLYERYRK